MPALATSLRLEDFDQPEIFFKYKAAFLSADSLNFILEFDHKNARAAFDLQHDDFRLAVHSEVSATTVGIVKSLALPTIRIRLYRPDYFLACCSWKYMDVCDETRSLEEVSSFNLISLVIYGPPSVKRKMSRYASTL